MDQTKRPWRRRSSCPHSPLPPTTFIIPAHFDRAPQLSAEADHFPRKIISKPLLARGKLDVLMTPIQRLCFSRLKTLLYAIRAGIAPHTPRGQRRIQHLATDVPQESQSSPPPQNIKQLHTGLLQRRMDGSFYMRELPSSASLIPYDSAEGKKIFKQALDEGGLEAFFPLSQQFLTQEEPACAIPPPPSPYIRWLTMQTDCGIGTLCMILNALKIDPAKTWRKPWRWFTQDMLDCCRPLEYVRTNGITLTEFTCLARCNGLDANTKYADKMSVPPSPPPPPTHT